jgi:hypothetical protein
LNKEYVRKVRLVLKAELSANDKIQAIGTLAIPIPRYNFGNSNWHQEKNTKTGEKNKKNADRPWTESPESRH